MPSLSINKVTTHHEEHEVHEEQMKFDNLSNEFKLKGIEFKLQQPLPVIYKDIRLDCGYRVDLLVAEGP